MKKNNLVLLFIFFAFIGMRLFHINADPPDDLSFSAGIFVDEMHNVHQVRNKILFGSANLDRYPSFAYSPIFGILQYVILSIIGIGLWQIKILPILLSIASLFFVYRSFSEHFDDRYGTIAAVLLGFNYTFIMYNRLGLYENLVIFFMSLTLFFWQRAVNIRKLPYFYLTGLSAGFVFIAKNIAFYFVISVALAFFIHIIRKGLKISFKPALIGLFGAGTAGTIWFFGCYLPFKADVTNLGSSWLKSTIGALTFWKMVETNPLMPLFIRFQFLPLTLLLALIFVGIVFYRFSINPRKVDDVELFILLWFFGGLFFLALLSYSPTRYYLPILPAVVLLAAMGVARYGGKTGSIRLRLSDWRLCLIAFLGVMMLSFYFIFPYIRKFKPQTAAFFFLDELTKTGELFFSAIVGITVLLVAGGLTWIRRTNPVTGTISYLLSVFLLSLIVLSTISHPLRAKIQIELNSGQNGKMRFYWGGNPPSYNEIDSNGIRIKKGSGIYSTLIGNLHSIKHLRIDPLTGKGEVLIKTIQIIQPGFKPIVFQTREQFQKFVPLHQIGQMRILADGLKVSSQGVDPYFHAELAPLFKSVLFAKYLLYLFLLALGIVLIFYFYLELIRRVKKNRSTIALNNANTGRKTFARLAMLFILAINMFYLIKWSVQGNYAIYKTSNEIGRRLSPSALIAGQGVMAATIENELRHVQAPNWYEDKKKLFFNYPITHLFLSHYAGYLGWYKMHYPKVMKNSEIIGTYRILNRDFYLYQINVPVDERSEAFRWK